MMKKIFDEELVEVLRFVNRDIEKSQEITWEAIRSEPQKLYEVNFRYLNKYSKLLENDFLVGFKNIFNIESDDWLDIKLDGDACVFYFTKSLIDLYNGEVNVNNTLINKAVSDVISVELFLQISKTWLKLADGENMTSGFRMREFVFRDLKRNPIIVIELADNLPSRSEVSTKIRKENLLKIVVPCCFDKDLLKSLKNKYHDFFEIKDRLGIQSEAFSYPELIQAVRSQIQINDDIKSLLNSNFVSDKSYSIFQNYLHSLVAEIKDFLLPDEQLNVESLSRFLCTLYFYPEDLKFIYYYPANLVPNKPSSGYSCFYKNMLYPERMIMWRTIFNLEAAPHASQMYESMAAEQQKIKDERDFFERLIPAWTHAQNFPLWIITNNISLFLQEPEIKKDLLDEAWDFAVFASDFADAITRANQFDRNDALSAAITGGDHSIVNILALSLYIVFKQLIRTDYDVPVHTWIKNSAIATEKNEIFYKLATKKRVELINCKNYKNLELKWNELLRVVGFQLNLDVDDQVLGRIKLHQNTTFTKVIRLIFVELLSNCVKYSFPIENSKLMLIEVKVSIIDDHNSWNLQYNDELIKSFRWVEIITTNPTKKKQSDIDRGGEGIRSLQLWLSRLGGECSFQITSKYCISRVKIPNFWGIGCDIK